MATRKNCVEKEIRVNRIIFWLCSREGRDDNIEGIEMEAVSTSEPSIILFPSSGIGQNLVCLIYLHKFLGSTRGFVLIRMPTIRDLYARLQAYLSNVDYHTDVRMYIRTYV